MTDPRSPWPCSLPLLSVRLPLPANTPAVRAVENWKRPSGLMVISTHSSRRAEMPVTGPAHLPATILKSVMGTGCIPAVEPLAAHPASASAATTSSTTACEPLSISVSP